MFELGRWHEPTPILMEAAIQLEKRSPQAFPIAGTPADFIRIGNPIDKLLFTGAFPEQTRLLSHASRNNA